MAYLVDIRYKVEMYRSLQHGKHDFRRTQTSARICMLLPASRCFYDYIVLAANYAAENRLKYELTYNNKPTYKDRTYKKLPRNPGSCASDPRLGLFAWTRATLEAVEPHTRG